MSSQKKVPSQGVFFFIIVLQLFCLTSEAGKKADSTDTTEKSAVTKQNANIKTKSTQINQLFLKKMKSDSALLQLSTENSRCGFAFYGALLQQHHKESMLFSPYSLSTSLVSCYSGAEAGTALQIAKVCALNLPLEVLHTTYSYLNLYFSSEPFITNGIMNMNHSYWVQSNFKLSDNFSNRIIQKYGADIYYVDIAAQLEQSLFKLSVWFNKNCHRQLQEPLGYTVSNPLSRLILASAFYYKSNWKGRFERENTRRKPFYTKVGDSLLVPMMHRISPANYFENNELQIAELPLAIEGVSMLFVLPKRVDGLGSIETKITFSEINDMIRKMSIRDVDLFIPHLNISSDLMLNDVLADMGMTMAFGGDANFSKMSDDDTRELCLSYVLHSGQLVIDEQGITDTFNNEKNSVISVDGNNNSSPLALPVFNANHPFFFMLRDSVSHFILLMGRVLNPGTD
ncbi:MAG: serpin family protein [Chitinivibrionales bacterium]|nr:serpin family protein [Chitinivibrionales bacterium]